MTCQPPDETLTTAEAADELNMSERQVRRYLTAGKLNGSRDTGHWKTTVLDIWKFKGIEIEMLENWRRYCLADDERQQESEDSDGQS